MARVMSDAELRRRRKMQGNIGRTTSTLGLTGAAIGTAAVLGSKSKGALRAINKVPGLRKANPEKLREAGLYTGLAAGGIGGVGGFNAASIYSDEARRRKQSMVKKELGMDMGYFGEEGRQGVVEKAWTPVASEYDSEKKRKKRAQVYEGGALIGAGAGGAYTAHHGMHAAREAKGVKVPAAFKARGKRAALGVGLTAAAAGTAAAVHRKRKEGSSWQSYSKSAAASSVSLSAFGVDHDLDH